MSSDARKLMLVTLAVLIVSLALDGLALFLFSNRRFAAGFALMAVVVPASCVGAVVLQSRWRAIQR